MMMENLSIHDPPPQQGAPMSQALGRGAPPPQQPQQLPPQMFTTAAQLLDLTDSTATPPSALLSYLCLS